MKLDKKSLASLGFCDLHTHTFYCDGKDSPEEMVQSAISKGLDTIGLVCHSFLKGQEDWCIKEENYSVFYNEVCALKDKYSGKIRILCGIERDYFSLDVPEYFDYTIGSVHMIESNGELYAIDESVEKLLFIKDNLFSGSWQALCENYYNLVFDVVDKTDCDIIGHFDLITKFNENDKLFSTTCDYYHKAWVKSADNLLLKKRAFEINTGAITRGFRTQAYPSGDILNYLSQRGAWTIFTSDAHKAEDIALLYNKVN